MKFAILALLLFVAPRPQQRLLAAVHLHPGQAVGAKNLPTGLLESRDNGATWISLAWPELISSSISVRGSTIALACGNGVMISRDAGAHWKLTGGWEMAEALHVRLDNRGAWAAGGFGLFRTDNLDTWRAVTSPLFRYCSDAIERDGRLLVASEVGIFVSEDHTSFRRVGPAVAVRRFDDLATLAATDGGGLLEAPNWTRIAGSPDICHVATRRDGAIYVGADDGLHVLRDGAWTHHPTAAIYGFSGALACGANGIVDLEGRDVALKGTIVGDLWSGEIPPVAESISPIDDALSIPGRAHSRPIGTTPGFENRQSELRDHFAKRVLELPSTDFFGMLSLVREGKLDAPHADALRKMLADPGHSMFFSLPAMTLFLYGGAALPADIRDRLAKVLVETPFYRGDTENHWTMHYAVELLATETWPASRWPTGQTTQELHDEARGWLLHWARLAATRGQGEFDSPTYLFMYLAPMVLLYDFTRDGEIRQLAGMMLDLLLADYAAESLEGAWCGAHSRASEGEVCLGAANAVTSVHYLFAGGIPKPKNLHGWIIPACYSSYQPPRQLAAIANRRGTAYLHTEVKRARNVLRYGDDLNPPVFKMTYMTADYAMGSIVEGIPHPIQQHTWGVTWKSAATNPTLFALHPWVSSRELAMFFSEDPHRIVDLVVGQKGYYGSPDKWCGGSPYEKVRQDRNVLLVMYKVPPGGKFPFVNLHVPDCLATTEKEGWIVGRDGAFTLAVYPCRAGEWTKLENARRFRCDGALAGFVVVADPTGDLPRPELTESSLTFGTHRLEWNRPADFPAGRLFDGPFVSSDVGSGVIEMLDRTLDFNLLEISEGRPVELWRDRVVAFFAGAFLLGAMFALTRRPRQ